MSICNDKATNNLSINEISLFITLSSFSAFTKSQICYLKDFNLIYRLVF